MHSGPTALQSGPRNSLSRPADVYSLVQYCTNPAMRTLPTQTRGSGGHSRFTFTSFSRTAIALLSFALSLSAAAKIKPQPPSHASSNIEISSTLADAIKAVEEVAADPILYGTYVYEHDKTLIGARQMDTSSAFGNDKPPGKVFYKVLDGVISPRHFKDTEDSGTITVRYVLRELTPATVTLRIDAVFIESARRAVHASQGAVESAEFGEVQQHLYRIQARAKEASDEALAEAAEQGNAEVRAQARQAHSAPMLAPEATPSVQEPVTTPSAPALLSTTAPAGSVTELEQRVNQLRHQVEARVKAPGAPLKSAPFHTATTIQSVPPNAEVAIVILTTYWYGVQTTDGHTGWIQRTQLEPLP